MHDAPVEVVTGGLVTAVVTAGVHEYLVTQWLISYVAVNVVVHVGTGTTGHRFCVVIRVETGGPFSGWDAVEELVEVGGDAASAAVACTIACCDI